MLIGNRLRELCDTKDGEAVGASQLGPFFAIALAYAFRVLLPLKK